MQPTRSWAEQRDLTTTLYAAARAEGLTTEKFDLDGSHTGTGGGNHLTLGGRQPVDSPLLRRPDLLRQPGVVLAAPPLALLPLLRPVHRPDQPGAAVRRGPARGRLRDGDRARRDRPADARAGRAAAVARRPRAAAPAHRPDRQHPPVRVLRRQALQPGLLARPARPARAARLRDAAAPADGARPGAAGARAGRDVLGAARTRPAGPLGHGAARGLPAAARRHRRHQRGGRRPARGRHRVRGVVARPVHRVPVPAARPDHDRRGSTSSCARPSSPGTSSARRRPPAGPRGTSTARSSASRSRSGGSTPRGTW